MLRMGNGNIKQNLTRIFHEQNKRSLQQGTMLKVMKMSQVVLNSMFHAKAESIFVLFATRASRSSDRCAVVP